MQKKPWFLGAAGALLGVWACSDLREPGLTEVEPLASHVVACDLRPVADAARRYLATPLQQQASDRLRQIEGSGCVGEASERLAWEVLWVVEQAFYQRVGGAAGDGASLVNGVFHCCIPAGGSFLLSSEALGNGGIYGIRGVLAGSTFGVGNTAPLLSRDPVPIVFLAEDGSQVVRRAIFGLRPKAPGTWQDVAFGSGQDGTFIDDVMALTGFPVGDAPHLGYRMDEGPDQGFQPGTQVDVIVCFTDGANAPSDPHDPAGDGDAFAARLRRNDVLLQTVPGAGPFCQAWVWGPLALQARVESPSLLGAVGRWAARVLLPEPLLAALRHELSSPTLGGSAGNFSTFQPQNSATGGSLAFVQVPPAVVNGTNTPFTVKVQALTGGGTPMEFVDVAFYILLNEGVPGELVGTFVRCDGSASATAAGCTLEPNGVATVTMSLSSPGGYRMCASGTAEGFHFEDVCTEERFHVRSQ